MAICHDARKGRYSGSHWSKPVAPPLHSTSLKRVSRASSSAPGANSRQPLIRWEFKSYLGECRRRPRPAPCKRKPESEPLHAWALPRQNPDVWSWHVDLDLQQPLCAGRIQGISGFATAWQSMGCAEIVALTIPGDESHASHLPSLSPPVPRAGPAGVSPSSLSPDQRVLRGVSGETPDLSAAGAGGTKSEINPPGDRYGLCLDEA